MVTLQRIAIYAALAIFALTALIYLKVQPFASWGQTITSAFTNINFDKITTTFWALIGSTGGATGAAVALGYAYTQIKKQKDKIIGDFNNFKNQASSTFDKLTGEKQAILDVKTKLETEGKGLMDKFTTEKQAAQDQVTQLKTQLTTVQSNYNSIDAQRIALQNQVLDMKAQALKAQAQLDVLVPKIK